MITGGYRIVGGNALTITAGRAHSERVNLPRHGPAGKSRHGLARCGKVRAPRFGRAFSPCYSSVPDRLIRCNALGSCRFSAALRCPADAVRLLAASTRAIASIHGRNLIEHIATVKAIREGIADED